MLIIYFGWKLGVKNLTAACIFFQLGWSTALETFPISLPNQFQVLSQSDYANPDIVSGDILASLNAIGYLH